MTSEDLIKKYPNIKEAIELAPFTTIKIGGPADFYYELRKIDQLSALIEDAKLLNLPWIVIGGGSNLVFSEKGFRGLVIHIKANSIKQIEQGIEADAGVLISQLIQFSSKNSLKGLENLAGLPGTLGGAIRGNAGANGTEIKDFIDSVTLFDPENGIHTEKNDYFDFSYRNSKIKKIPNQIVLKAALKLHKATPEEVKQMQETIKNNLIGRTGRQPQGMTTGSFFKNPSPENPAGKLLDQSGCKGLTVGKAQISDLHANWVINLGGATQEDIMELAKMAQNKVKQQFDILLEPEVQLIGPTGYIAI